MLNKVEIFLYRTLAALAAGVFGFVSFVLLAVILGAWIGIVAKTASYFME